VLTCGVRRLWFSRARRKTKKEERERERGRGGETNGPPGNLSLFRGARCNFGLARERRTNIRARFRRAAMKRDPRVIPRPRCYFLFFFIYLFPPPPIKARRRRRTRGDPHVVHVITAESCEGSSTRVAVESSSRDMTGVIRRGHESGMREEGGAGVRAGKRRKCVVGGQGEA